LPDLGPRVAGLATALLGRDEVHEKLEKFQTSDLEVENSLRVELRNLEAKEERLVDLAADGSIARPKLRGRLDYTTIQRGAIEGSSVTPKNAFITGLSFCSVRRSIGQPDGALQARVRQRA
jgi:hypothetical protein